jgi:hypothetical protein
MTDQRKGFTVRVLGAVPESVVQQLANAIPGPVRIETAEEAAAACGAGSELGRMMAHVFDPQPHETWEQRIARQDREAFEKATKVDAKDYTGWVSWPTHGPDEGFFESIEALRKYCAGYCALPTFVWACTREPLSLNANWILDQALEEHHDGAWGEASSAEELRLQAMLDEWAAAQGIVSWNEDRSRAVML